MAATFSVTDRLAGGRSESSLGLTAGHVTSGRPAERTDERAESRPGERERQARLARLKGQVQRAVLTQLEQLGAAHPTETDLRERVAAELDAAAANGLPLSRADRTRLLDEVLAELLAYGPIQPLLRDERVTEIMVNGPHQVWVERGGVLEETDVRFEDDEHVRRIIERIVAPLGRRIDESSPMVDARLPDGSRVNAVIPPLSLIGPTLTIRRFSKTPLTVQQLIQHGALSACAAEFLAGCVRGQANMLVSGGTGSGKTTLLNVLSSSIPEGERIVTIEDAAELRLRQRHVVPMEARAANAEGSGAVPIRSLLVNALRMRPDRIVIGECRGGEALDMLQAMNTGHDGSMTTLHANSTEDALARLETMVLMSGAALPHRAIREQIAAAIDVVVQVERLRDGSRRVVEIAEVTGMRGEEIGLQSIFQTPFDRQTGIGPLTGTGVTPQLTAKLERRGVVFPEKLFARSGG